MNNPKPIFNIHFLFSTVFGLGKLPKSISIITASLVAIPLSFLILLVSTKLLSFTEFDTQLNALLLSLFILSILTGLSIYSSSLYARQINVKDPNEVVIDEVLGQSLSIILTIPLTYPLIIFSNLSERFHISNPSLLIAAFTLNIILFRIFDSLKPWPISALERLKDGFGIILDDIGAGFFAAIVYYVILFAVIS